MFCPCGKEIESTSVIPYSIVRYDDKGNIVYVICIHGYIVIDNGIENFSTGELNKLNELEGE